MNSLEEFDRKNAAARAKLERELKLAHQLPTGGVTVTWIGEDGWKSDGNTRKPDIERTIDVAPWIIHDSFRGAAHVAYKAPDSLAGGKGEHVSSKHRSEFVRKYLRAVLDTYAPYVIDTVAVKGAYASYMPETFDWESHKDYADGREVNRGLYEIEASQGNGYSSAKLSFYARTDATGPVQVSFDLHQDFQTHRMQARAHYDNDMHNAVPVRWSFPTLSDIGAVCVWKRSNGDRNRHGQPSGYTMEWLFDTREAMETAIGLVQS